MVIMTISGLGEIYNMIRKINIIRQINNLLGTIKNEKSGL